MKINTKINLVSETKCCDEWNDQFPLRKGVRGGTTWWGDKEYELRMSSYLFRGFYLQKDSQKPQPILENSDVVPNIVNLHCTTHSNGNSIFLPIWENGELDNTRYDVYQFKKNVWTRTFSSKDFTPEVYHPQKEVLYGVSDDWLVELDLITLSQKKMVNLKDYDFHFTKDYSSVVGIKELGYPPEYRKDYFKGFPKLVKDHAPVQKQQEPPKSKELEILLFDQENNTQLTLKEGINIMKGHPLSLKNSLNVLIRPRYNLGDSVLWEVKVEKEN